VGLARRRRLGARGEERGEQGVPGRGQEQEKRRQELTGREQDHDPSREPAVVGSERSDRGRRGLSEGDGRLPAAVAKSPQPPSGASTEPTTAGEVQRLSQVPRLSQKMHFPRAPASDDAVVARDEEAAVVVDPARSPFVAGVATDTAPP